MLFANNTHTRYTTLQDTQHTGGLEFGVTALHCQYYGREGKGTAVDPFGCGGTMGESH